ncbi:hypothetical protein NP233_g7308 [Leucocoprinus birnbaumii]|uniref:Uncharacterized protein n=1 Tax=Leucocoprinus birnbaumii TaxID=56174 RepID=A0AAD5VSS1_9AGAR|nr:hypothetical protein NP233_g7308 [Leucocoprinus birnbaumii]
MIAYSPSLQTSGSGSQYFPEQNRSTLFCSSLMGFFTNSQTFKITSPADNTSGRDGDRLFEEARLAIYSAARHQCDAAKPSVCQVSSTYQSNTHLTHKRSDFAGFSGNVTGTSVEERNQLEEQLEEIRRKLAERKARKKQMMTLTGDRSSGETKIPVLSQGCPATYHEQADGVSTPVAEALPFTLIPGRGATCNLAPAPPDSEPPPYDSLESGSSDPVNTE